MNEDKDDDKPSDAPSGEVGEPLTPTDKQVLESVPPKVLRAIATLREEYAGWIPHPRLFQQWEKVLPGSAERILRMAEKQQDHRMILEQTNSDANIWKSKWGLILGFIIFVLFGAGSFFLILNGHSEIGVTFVILAIGSLMSSLGVSYFVRQSQLRATSRNRTDRTLERKSDGSNEQS